MSRKAQLGVNHQVFAAFLGHVLNQAAWASACAVRIETRSARFVNLVSRRFIIASKFGIGIGLVSRSNHRPRMSRSLAAAESNLVVNIRSGYGEPPFIVSFPR